MEAAWSADALPGVDPESTSYMPPSPVRTQTFDTKSFDTTPLSPRMDVHERRRILILNPDFVTLRSDLLEQEKFTPRSKVLALVAKFSVLMFLNITLGGGAFKSPWGIECGGVAFWIVHIIMIAFLVSSAWAAQTYLVNRHELKELLRFDYVHGDIKWDQRKAIIYPCFFMLAGVFAGMFGSKYYNYHGVHIYLLYRVMILVRLHLLFEIPVVRSWWWNDYSSVNVDHGYSSCNLYSNLSNNGVFHYDANGKLICCF